MVEPMFGITPETLNAVNVISPFWPAVFFLDDNMITAQTQRAIRVPVIGVVETSRLRVLLDEGNKRFGLAGGNGYDSYFPVALHHAEYQNLAPSAPAPFPLSFSAKYGFVAFNNTFQNRFALLDKT